MLVTKISEHGYDEAVLGFSLSYNTSIERVKQILPKYAFGIPGESKFLECMMLWLDVTAPRYWWQEADTYRVGVTKQSASTMHTLMKDGLSQEMFEFPLPNTMFENLKISYDFLKEDTTTPAKQKLLAMKNMLPEGFLQRRIWMFSYKTLQNMYVQRINHKLPQWQYFLNTVISFIDHPEFIIKEK